MLDEILEAYDVGMVEPHMQLDFLLNVGQFFGSVVLDSFKSVEFLGVVAVADKLNLGEAARAQVGLPVFGSENHVVEAFKDSRHIIIMCFNLNLDTCLMEIKF